MNSSSSEVSDQQSQNLEAGFAGNPSSVIAEDDFLDTRKLLKNLKERAVRGAAITFSAQAIKFGLTTGSTMILARLLTPEDFGLIAIVTAVVAFMDVFMDAGLSMATIQKEVVTHAELTALFWINVALGAALMVLTVGLAPVLSAIYHEPRLTWIAFALAFTFLFGGLAVQHKAILRRQMHFRQLALIDILTVMTGISVALAMAFAGTGYWALIGLTLGTSLGNAVFVWFFSRWRPGRPVRAKSVGPMLQFGGYLTAGSFINSVREQLPYVVIGYSFGAAAVATYERAYRLLLLPVVQMMPPMSAVALPALSRLQNDPVKFRRAARQLITLVSAVTVPCSLICGTARPPFLRYCLHSQRLRPSRRSGSGCWWRPVTAEHCSVSP
jgi:O-antigen/teichoic acid export membrane protein